MTTKSKEQEIFDMGAIVFPDMPDQTTKQPTVFRCQNPECWEKLADGHFDFVSDRPLCQKCGAGPPVVHKRALIHLLARHPKGRIEGQFQRHYVMLCDDKRDYIATNTNGEAGTGDPTIANCPGCLAVLERELRKAGRSSLTIGPEDLGSSTVIGPSDQTESTNHRG